MLKGIEFLRKKSWGLNTSPDTLSSLRVKRSNPLTSLRSLLSLRVKRSNLVTSPLAGEVDTKCRVRGITNTSTGATPTPPASVILGLVPKILLKQGINLINKFALSDGNVTGLLRCARNHDRQGEVGRSMIEMLGVLAIIGVLSLGGIAGYSKAMEKYKINKAVEDYSYLIQGLLENIDDIKKMSDADCKHQYSMVEVAYAKGLVPGTWTRLNNLGNSDFDDSLGNNIRPFIRCNRLVIDFYLGGRYKNDDGFQSKGFPFRFCEALIQNMAQPLHEVVNRIAFSDGNAWYGDSVCDADKKCLRNVSLPDIHKKCSSGLIYFLLDF